MRKIILIGTALLALISAPAMAADLPVRKAPPPPPPPVCVWCGFYFGIHGGWGQANVDTRFRREFALVVDDVGISNDFSGGMFGAHAGYNWQVGGNWLFGLEIAGTWTDIGKTVDNPFPLLSAPFTDRFGAEINWLFTFTPRLGVTAGNVLLYVKGGLAVADISASFDRFFFVTDPPILSLERSTTRTGWTFGGGFEVLTGSTFLFGPGGSWVFGIEGNYYDFGSVSADSGPVVIVNPLLVAPPGPTTIRHERDFTMWSVLGRLSWKFGGPSVAARY